MEISKVWIWTLSLIASTIVGMLLFWILFLNHTSINEIGIEYNALNGEISLQETPGWYATSPLVRVTYISTLPFKVRVPSRAKVIVAKMVMFNPIGIKEYIRMQGFDYALNSDLHNVFLGYAYSGHEYSFMTIIQETTQENTNQLRPVILENENITK